MKLLFGHDGRPLFSSKRVAGNFIVLVLCSQFAFSVLAMKGALLPQMLELWQISKTQFGLLMSIYGIVHNVFYLALAWAQDRFSPRLLIPVNMVLGGVTTFFLGQTNDFLALCFLFVMLSLWCEGAFWPAVLSSVRKSTSDSNQGKIFGLLEGGRGGIELLQNTLTVGLYTFLGYSLLGLEIAFMVNAGVMIILGIAAWFMLPKATLLKSGDDRGAANREVLAGMSMTLRLPEVWLAGFAGFTVYLAYTSMPFFLTYLQDLHALPVLAISIFGIVSTSAGRIGIALPSGFIADRFFGGASGGLRSGLLGVAIIAAFTIALTLSGGGAWTAMVLMSMLSVLFFFMRALYFAPFGEMGLPPRFSGSVIAVAAFIIYLPSSFAYLLWGFILDYFPGAAGYALMFGTLGVMAVAGAWVAHRLHTRILGGTAVRISARLAAIDAKLGLVGDEKTLGALVDEQQQ